MKVIYEASDGTKFEYEEDCKNYESSTAKQTRFEALQEFIDNNLNYFSETIVAAFIIDNIQEINKILDSGSKYTFTGKYGEVYKAVDDPDTSCNDCIFKAVKFIEGENCCNSKEEFDCSENKIIWIKK